ncbi:MAG: site-specific integrase [Rudaea sp.]
MSLSSAFNRYLHEISPQKKPSTRLRDASRVAVIAKSLGKYSLAAITPAVVAGYRDERLALGKSTTTVRLELALLSHTFTIAIKEWRLGLVQNPVSNTRKPTPAPGRERRLSANEEERLLAACDAYSNPMLGWLVRLAIETTMRMGEMLGLTLADVDLPRRIAHVRDSKNGESRTIPLSMLATQVLREAIDNPTRPDDTNLIFFGNPGRDGKRKPYQFSKIWKNIINSLGLKDLHFHDLRHEGTSRLVESGFSDLEAMAITGHKSTQMLKRYTHLRTVNMLAKLDAIHARAIKA